MAVEFEFTRNRRRSRNRFRHGEFRDRSPATGPIAPYRSPAEWDHHFAETIGFGDPILDSEDEYRFDPESRRLVSLRFATPNRAVPRDDLLQAAADVPAKTVLPRLRSSADLNIDQMQWIWMDGEVRQLAIWSGKQYGATNFEACEIGRDLRFFWNDEVCGLLLLEPVSHFGDWVDESALPRPSRQACRAVAEFVRTITDDFLDRLYDDDVDVLTALNDLVRRLRALDESHVKDELLFPLLGFQARFKGR